MYSQSDIEDAVAAGAIAPEQADRLRDHVALRNGTPTGDEEYIRVLRGYNDVFVAYACVVALVTVGWLGTMIPFGGGRPARGLEGLPNLPLFAALFVTVAAWGLAEIFTRRRNTALPSILLAVAFTFGVFTTLTMLMASVIGRGMGQQGGAIIVAVMAVIAGGAAWLFWRRFRVPIAPSLTAAMGIVALVLLLGGMFARSSAGGTIIPILVLLAGLAVFAFAMQWEAKDPWRITMNSDVAFWLQWTAAASVIYPIMFLFGLNAGVTSIGGAILMLVIFLLATLVGLVVNRRIWVAFGVMPLAFAISGLARGGSRRSRESEDFGEGFGGAYGGGDYDTPAARDYGGGASNNPFDTEALLGTFTTVLIISLLMLLLAIFWSQIRRAVVGVLPEELRERLPATDRTAHLEAQRFE